MHLITAIVFCVAGWGLGAWLWHRKEDRWKELLAAERAEATNALEAERQTSFQAQAQQRALFESMAEGVLLLDRKGKIAMANKSLRELLRVTGEIRGKTILEAVRIPLLAEMAKQLAAKDVIRNSELELAGISPQLLEVNVGTVVDQQGRSQ